MQDEHRDRDHRDDDSAKGGEAGGGVQPPPAAPEAVLDGAEKKIGRERQERRRNGAGQDQRIVVHPKTAEDIAAEAAGVDRRRDRRGADRDHRRDANARNDNAEGQRHLDLQEQLPVGHAESPARLADRRIDAVDAGEGVADDRQERVERERRDRRARADAADNADMKQINIEGNQKAEQREARHRLHDVGEAEDRLAERGTARERDAERHADENRDAGRYGDEKKVPERELNDPGAGGGEKMPEIHGAAATSSTSRRHETNATPSGSRDARKSAGRPSSTTRPSFSSAMREASRNASPTSCVTKAIVFRAGAAASGIPPVSRAA